MNPGMRPVARARISSTLARACLIALASASAAASQTRLPYGLAASYQSEYSIGRSGLERAGGDDEQEIFENWLDVDLYRGSLTAGARFVAFRPPDPTIHTGEASHGVDFLYAELQTSRLRARAGNFYALFGRGLALRLYEDRPLRVDQNARGATGTLWLPDGELTVLAGETVAGSSEDAHRERSEGVYGADLEHALLSAGNVRLGGSWAMTRLLTRGGASMEALNIGALRTSATVLGVDVAGEVSMVEGPNAFAATRRSGSRFRGHGVYGSASTSVGRLGLVVEVKDYDALIFQNDAGKTLNQPPSALRAHTFNLLNRHPHVLDPADERGFQVEATWTTERLWAGNPTTFLVNWGLTRNQRSRDLGNHFDDVLLDVQQEIGERISLTGALSYQRSFVSRETPEPLRRTWTPIADLRVRVTDVHSAHLQLEHQHEISDAFGEFDVQFVVLEWSRSPNLTVGFLVEHTNKSDLQLERLVESGRDFAAISVDYTLFDQHDLRLFYGKRNAGFICVGGVCRLEPAFDGVEMSLLTRF